MKKTKSRKDGLKNCNEIIRSLAGKYLTYIGDIYKELPYSSIETENEDDYSDQHVDNHDEELEVPETVRICCYSLDLKLIGFDRFLIGLILTFTLINSVIFTLVTSLFQADRIGRRENAICIYASLMAISDIVFHYGQAGYWVL